MYKRQKAQRAARAEERGIWNARTNEGGARRDYERLAAWWAVRAQAVDTFRRKAEASPRRFVAADDADGLQAALDAGGKGVTVLALIDRFFDEDDGSRTVLLRASDKRRAVRVRIEPGDIEAMGKADLEGSMGDFRQNYLLVKGHLVRGQRGFDLEGAGPTDWRRAGPEPSAPIPAGSRR